jgi:hypothetical protein
MVVAPQRVRPRLLGSPVSLARSQKAPPPETRPVVHRVVAPTAVVPRVLLIVFIEVPVDQ